MDCAWVCVLSYDLGAVSCPEEKTHSNQHLIRGQTLKGVSCMDSGYPVTRMTSEGLLTSIMVRNVENSKNSQLSRSILTRSNPLH